MRSILFGLFLILLSLPFAAHAQLIAEDNFDSVVGGQGVSPPAAFWGSGVRTTVRDDVSHSPSNSLRFNFKSEAQGSEDAWAEQRFNLGGERTELTIMYDLYIPANYHHRSAGGSTNNKFLRLWTNGYGDDEKIGGSFHVGDGSVISDISVEYRSNPGQGMSKKDKQPFILSSDLGKWMAIKIYARAATNSSNGKYEIWKNGNRILNHSVENNHHPGTQGWTTGYLFGYANSGFDTQVWLNMDNVRFYDTFVDGDTPVVRPLSPIDFVSE